MFDFLEKFSQLITLKFALLDYMVYNYTLSVHRPIT